MVAEHRTEALEARCAQLEEQVAMLERALGMDFLTPVEWRLTGQQMRLFGVLMTRELMTPAAAMAALLRDRIDDGPDPKIVDVQVCKMRKVLTPLGIVIQTRWGQGYFLSPEGKARAADLMNAQVAA